MDVVKTEKNSTVKDVTDVTPQETLEQVPDINKCTKTMVPQPVRKEDKQNSDFEDEPPTSLFDNATGPNKVGFRSVRKKPLNFKSNTKDFDVSSKKQEAKPECVTKLGGNVSQEPGKTMGNPTAIETNGVKIIPSVRSAIGATKTEISSSWYNDGIDNPAVPSKTNADQHVMNTCEEYNANETDQKDTHEHFLVVSDSSKQAPGRISRENIRKCRNVAVSDSIVKTANELPPTISKTEARTLAPDVVPKHSKIDTTNDGARMKDEPGRSSLEKMSIYEREVFKVKTANQFTLTEKERAIEQNESCEEKFSKVDTEKSPTIHALKHLRVSETVDHMNDPNNRNETKVEVDDEEGKTNRNMENKIVSLTKIFREVNDEVSNIKKPTKPPDTLEEPSDTMTMIISELSVLAENSASPPHYENLRLEAEAHPPWTDQQPNIRQVHPFTERIMQRLILFDRCVACRRWVSRDHVCPLLQRTITIPEVCLECYDHVSSQHVCLWRHSNITIMDICLVCCSFVRNDHICPLLPVSDGDQQVEWFDVHATPHRYGASPFVEDNTLEFVSTDIRQG